MTEQNNAGGGTGHASSNVPNNANSSYNSDPSPTSNASIASAGSYNSQEGIRAQYTCPHTTSAIHGYIEFRKCLPFLFWQFPRVESDAKLVLLALDETEIWVNR